MSPCGLSGWLEDCDINHQRQGKVVIWVKTKDLIGIWSQDLILGIVFCVGTATGESTVIQPRKISSKEATWARLG